MKNNGFTLLEILIALIILVGGVIAISRAFSAGLFATTDIENVDLALNIAQAKMEDVKNIPFGNLSDSGPNPDPNFPNFRVSVDAAEDEDPMQIGVTVAWQTKGGETNLILITLVADY